MRFRNAITDRIQAYGPSVLGVLFLFLSNPIDRVMARAAGVRIDENHYISIGIAAVVGWLVGCVACGVAMRRIRSGIRDFAGPGMWFSFIALVLFAVLDAVLCTVGVFRPTLHFAFAFTCYSVLAYAAPPMWKTNISLA